MSFWQLVLANIEEGMELKTPGRGIPPTRQATFSVGKIGSGFVTIVVGKGKYSWRIEKGVFELVDQHLTSAPTPFLRIAAIHGNVPLANSVDELIRDKYGTRYAAVGNYIAAILEKAGAVEYIMIGRQKHIRLKVK